MALTYAVAAADTPKRDKSNKSVQKDDDDPSLDIPDDPLLDGADVVTTTASLMTRIFSSIRCSVPCI